jgi:hypothetical protein
MDVYFFLENFQDLAQQKHLLDSEFTSRLSELLLVCDSITQDSMESLGWTGYEFNRPVNVAQVLEQIEELITLGPKKKTKRYQKNRKCQFCSNTSKKGKLFCTPCQKARTWT